MIFDLKLWKQCKVFAPVVLLAKFGYHRARFCPLTSNNFFVTFDLYLCKNFIKLGPAVFSSSLVFIALNLKKKELAILRILHNDPNGP